MLPPRVFVSYARSDGEKAARELTARLEAAGIAVWRDRDGLHGGRDWWQQITAALDVVHWLVLVMTDGALASEMVQREWRHARQKGVSVVPVFGRAGLALDVLPSWMRAAHFVDPGLEWTRLVNDLKTTPQRVRVPFMVDALPDDFVVRSRELDALRDALLERRHSTPLAVTVALRGAGGFGKSVLARALCHDEDVQTAFKDGVLWVTLGDKPGDLPARVEDLIEILCGRRPAYASLEAATATLVELLAERELLIVIDDVWDAAHLEPFLQGGARCARIVTTRLRDVAPARALRIDVDAMAPHEARRLLGNDLPGGRDAELRVLAERLGEWPLLLKLVNATLRERVARGQPLLAAIDYARGALERRGPTFFDLRDAGSRGSAVARTLDISIAQLDEQERRRFEELAVFAEDASIPLRMVARLWHARASLDDLDSEALCERLARLSLLLQFDLATMRIRLHDVVRQYLLTRVRAELPAMHAALVDAARPTSGRWTDLPHDELDLRDELLRHLHGAASLGPERRDELRRTALDLSWLAQRIIARSVLAAQADLALAQSALPGDVAVPALHRALGQAAHVVGRCVQRREVELTLLTRLGHLGMLDDSTAALRASIGSPRLDADAALPDLPEVALERTLTARRGALAACALSADGRIAATGGSGTVLRVWDTATGAEPLNLGAYSVWALAISSDGTTLAAACTDRRLRLWRLDGGTLIAELVGHTDVVSGCAISADGAIVATASLDGSVRVWDIGQKRVTHVLARRWVDDASGWTKPTDDAGHWSGVQGCALSPDARHVVTASSDQTLIVWDLADGRALQTLHGHDAQVRGCAFSPCGRWIASAGSDATARLWDVRRLDAAEPVVLRGHDGAVGACAFSADGRVLVTAGNDGRLLLWHIDDDGGAARRAVLDAHAQPIAALSLSADGCTALTASADGSARLWDLARTAPGEGRARQARLVSCASSDEPALLVTGAEDGRLTFWRPGGVTSVASHGDRTSWRIAATVQAHTAAVYDCAIDRARAQVVTAGGDRELRVWDASDGTLRRRHVGHRGAVTGCDASAALLASCGSDGSLRLWDTQTSSRRLAWAAHAGGATACTFAPDGRHVVSAGVDGTLRWWPTEVDEALWERWVSERRPLRVPPDAASLVAPVHDAPIRALAWSADGRWLVVATDDGFLKVFRDGDGRQPPVIEVRAAAGAFQAVAASPDGRHVATVGDEGAISVWRTGDGGCAAGLRVDGSLWDCTWTQGGAGLVAVGDRGAYFLRWVE